MKKTILFCLCILVVVALAVPSFAAFKDVPNSHWASKSVAKLGKLGVTQGYPDGTFRGNKTITRYEVAIFLSNLADALEEKISAIPGTESGQKLVEELKAEVAALKADVDTLKSGPPGESKGWSVGGSAETALLATDLFVKETGQRTGHWPAFRVKGAASKSLGSGTSFKVGFDTNYQVWQAQETTTIAGVATPGPGLVISGDVLDFGLNANVDLGLENPVALSVTQGTGNIADALQAVINATGLGAGGTTYAGQYGSVINRPYNAVTAATAISGVEVSGGYEARSGLAGVYTSIGEAVNLWKLGVGYGFGDVPYLGNVKLTGGARLYVAGINPLSTSYARDTKYTVDVAAKPDKDFDIAGTIGYGNGVATGSSALALSGKVVLADYFKSGTNVTVIGTRLGSSYINTTSGLNSYLNDAPTNIFNYTVPGGTTDIGGKVEQVITDTLSGYITADYLAAGNLSGGLGWMAEGGLLYAVAPSAKVGLMYRAWADRANSLTGTDYIKQDYLAAGLVMGF